MEVLLSERPTISEHSPGWMACVWSSFATSLSLMIFGIYSLPVDIWIKADMLMGLMFSVGSCFNLAKTLRDNHESKKLINRVNEVKTERILPDFEMKDLTLKHV